MDGTLVMVADVVIDSLPNSLDDGVDLSGIGGDFTLLAPAVRVLVSFDEQ